MYILFGANLMKPQGLDFLNDDADLVCAFKDSINTVKFCAAAARPIGNPAL
jgi:hypothetical protein